MAAVHFKRLDAAIAQAEKNAREDELEQELPHGMGLTAMVVGKRSGPRPEDSPVRDSLLNDADACHASAKAGTLQSRGSAATSGKAQGIGPTTATSSIELIPKEPAHVTVTKGIKTQRPVSSTAAAMSQIAGPQLREPSVPIESFDNDDAPIRAFETEEPLGENLSNLIEDFAAEEAQLAMSEAPEPLAIARAAAVQVSTPPAASRDRVGAAPAREAEGLRRTGPGIPVDRVETMSAEPAGNPQSSVAERGASSEEICGTAMVPIERLHLNRLQPRRGFEGKGLQALAESLKESGMLQPILVRRHPQRPREFEIVAGERRFRAAKRARLAKVPIVIRELSDCEALELALVENVQRQDLTPLERAEGYYRLIEGFNKTQEDLARVLCKSRSHVANTLRLLNLSPAIKEMLQQGELSASHARALLNAERPDDLARRVVTEGLSVRETEFFAQKREANGSASHAAKSAKSPEIAALERDLAALLGLKITILTHGQGGTLTIHYTTPEQLENILRCLSPVECAPERH